MGDELLTAELGFPLILDETWYIFSKNKLMSMIWICLRIVFETQLKNFWRSGIASCYETMFFALLIAGIPTADRRLSSIMLSMRIQVQFVGKVASNIWTSAL